MKRLVLALATILFAALPASADDYSEGMAAFSQRQYTQAVTLWGPIAESGHVGAQFNLGRMYFDGIGVIEDKIVAIAWYARAAERDFAPAMVQYGLALISGLHIEGNHPQGVDFILRAADSGNAEGQFQAGKLYRDGVAVERDYDEAVSWYLAAAEQNHTRAQYRMGFMYGSGYGVPQDFVQAYYFYGLAAARMPISGSAQTQLTEYMSLEEIASAEALLNGTPTIASTE
ncbi:MAG: sel1 repeat family protein [Rhodospirillaceae bacterium]|nr:sel1 repeat family protein [Rhodospirillaceae bacterium]MBT6203682.1 sel1 repeat family protein [Rhodospirillaceae bacterium]MBT7612106.1 sel1 repeat family protein [Rhodospirillaceae bacterium]MBT7646887.1 sel1 repeat family protein [Rhodospirillaceae bacterium]